MIYKLVLPINQSIELWPRLSGEHSTDNTRAFRSRIKEYKRTIIPTLKLLRVNKQINKAAAELFYGENEFRFTNIRGFIVLQCFFQTIGTANAARVRRVTVHAPFDGLYRDHDNVTLGTADNLPGFGLEHGRSP